jgi:hypothetical protein
VGHSLDIFHDYHPAGSIPLSRPEKYFATRPHTHVYVGWQPASTWAAADGGNAAVNAGIDRAAASIKSITPHKIFLTLWQEPQHAVTGGTSCPLNRRPDGGTPAQYRAMWRNVEARFRADGVTNVVWVMDYQGSPQWACLVRQMWPGNSLIDWVTYDTYSTGTSSTWDNTVGWFYSVLTHDSNKVTDFTSKPWGVAEFGDCATPGTAHASQYYLGAKAALDANGYPRLKMYMVYDNSLGPRAGLGCLTNYTVAGAYDPAKQTGFNLFADDPIFTGLPR